MQVNYEDLSEDAKKAIDDAEDTQERKGIDEALETLNAKLAKYYESLTNK